MPKFYYNYSFTTFTKFDKDIIDNINLTFRYNGLPSESHGARAHLSDAQEYLVNLNPGERIVSMKINLNISHKFVCGISMQTNVRRTFGTFGVESRMLRELKSPYKTGYYINSFVGAAGDILFDLRATFTSEYASPFVRSSSEDLQKTACPKITSSSTISSAGSGYHSDDHLQDSPRKIKPSASIQNAEFRHNSPPTPPPRFGLKSLKKLNSVPRRSNISSKGSILTHRPIMTK